MDSEQRARHIAEKLRLARECTQARSETDSPETVNNGVLAEKTSTSIRRTVLYPVSVFENNRQLDTIGKEDEILRKLDRLSEEISELKKNVNLDNTEMELVKRQQLLLLRGTQAQEEIMRNFAENLEHILNCQVDFNNRLTEIERFATRIENIDEKLDTVHVNFIKMNDILANFPENYVTLMNRIDEINDKLHDIESQKETFGQLDEKIGELCLEFQNSEADRKHTADKGAPQIFDKEKHTEDIQQDSVQESDSNTGELNTLNEVITSPCYTSESDKKERKQASVTLAEDIKSEEDGVIVLTSFEYSADYVPEKLETLQICVDKDGEYGWYVYSYDTFPKEKLEKTASVPAITYKCWNSNCHFVFTKDLKVEDDKVSIRCPNPECTMVNIVGKLDEGNKWMGIQCSESISDKRFIYCSRRRERYWHRQQFPVDTKEGDFIKCQICGKTGTVKESNYEAATYIENAVNDDCQEREESKEEADMESNASLMDDVEQTETTLRCFNFKCNEIFEKDINLRPDGVSVKCPNEKCRKYNIVGKLTEGNKWILMNCDGYVHYQQVEESISSKVQCKVCGRNGHSFGSNDHTAVCVRIVLRS